MRHPKRSVNQFLHGLREWLTHNDFDKVAHDDKSGVQ